jgi:hypothetical protein
MVLLAGLADLTSAVGKYGRSYLVSDAPATRSLLIAGALAAAFASCVPSSSPE